MLRALRAIALTAFDRLVFAAFVPKDHYLRRVKADIDFERCRDRFTDVYDEHQGRPAVDPILMLKLEFLSYQYNLSDREVIKQSRVNIAYRFFLDLRRKSVLPHHTSLTYFRERLGAKGFQKIFQDIVRQARERGLVKDRLRLKDATHVIANIAIPSAIRLVGDTRRRLLAALRPWAATRVAEEEQRADNIRAATEDLADQERLLQRVAHLRSLVAWVDEQFPPQPSPPSEQEALREAVALAHKVLRDRDEPGAGDKTLSVHDAEARTGKHGKFYDGYQVDVAMDADSELITALNVLPANGDEARDAAVLIEQEEQAQGNDVATVSMDGIGFNGPVLRDLTQRLSLEVIVPPKQQPETALFTPDQFTLDEAGTTLTCPAGQTSARMQRTKNARQFYFARATCQDCPRQRACVKELPKTNGRGVQINDYEKEYQDARTKAQTPEYERVRHEHPKIERKLGEIVRWHGGRRARYRGQGRVLLQMIVTTLVVNVKRIVRLLNGLGAAPGGTVRAEAVAGGV